MPKGKIGSWNEKYIAINRNFDGGGNGSVSIVKDRETGKEYVLKELRKFSEERNARFVDEIHVMYNNYKTIDGILPVYDYSEEEYWYIMPRAELIVNYIKNNQISFDDRIDIVINYAEILNNLHIHNICHRDIKPLNLYAIGDKYYFGDFGLADFPDSPNDFTRSDRGLGAIFTIAPEMKRDPKHADGKKADVYSFLKTVWMLLTLDEKGFDGQYNRADQTMALSNRLNDKRIHLKELEDIIEKSTDNNPERRPSMSQALALLKEYRDIKKDYNKAQESDWQNLSKQIFGDHEPSSCSWEDNDKIIDILNVIGKNPAYNHIFFQKGGLTFNYAKKANEEGCIEIYAGLNTPDIVKPKRLIYEGFGKDYSWNYFLLELDELTPVDDESVSRLAYEELVEDIPAHYVSARYASYGVYDYDTGEKFPDGWREVRRHKHGKLLVVFNHGLYNAITATYDGRHAMCSSDDFKKYIKTMIDVEHKLITSGKNVEGGMNYIFRQNPFCKEVIPDETVCLPDGSDFINHEFQSWEFDVKEYVIPCNYKIRFKLAFRQYDTTTIFIFDEDKYILSTSGKFISDVDSESTLWIYDRYEAQALRKKISEEIKNICLENGYDYPEFISFIDINMDYCDAPTHLFSKQELIEKLKEADDRENNTIVINENGEIEAVPDSIKFLFPVRNETFIAGNNYVGKYADVKSVADDLYPDLLGGWRNFLKTEMNQYIDYSKYSDKDVDKIVKDITENYMHLCMD